jgi:drug/metabolite transporter (DMT)-like permease
VFLTLGGRLVSATENALVSTIETPLAVVWVWLAFQEVPSSASLIGGLIVLGAVVAHAAWTARG